MPLAMKGPGSGRRGRRLLLALLAAVVQGACSDAFEPTDNSGQPFSIFGVLDAAADTQWIRVNGLRSTLLPSTAPTGFTATLEDLGSGRVIELRDTATLYPQATMLGADSVYAHNFWTAERLEPGASYRLRVQSTDGAVSQAVVEIPGDFRAEVWIGQPERKYAPVADAVWLAGVKQVAFVGTEKYYWDECTQLGLQHWMSPQATGGDSVSRTVGIGQDTAGVVRWTQGRTCGDTWYTKKELLVVASGAAWPFGQDFSTWRMNSTASNVTNGVGFVGGVLIKRLPYERCEWTAYSTAEKYCKLRYDSTTATLTGSIFSACPLRPDSVRVVLREIDPGPTEPLPRVRRPYVDRSGHYEIGAIRPGLRHELSITGGVGSWAYSSYTDTLTFTPGQHVTHTATLDWTLRLGSCQW